MSLKIHELLDRFEILYPDDEDISNLRRACVDQDFSSIFKLVEHDEDLRSAVVDRNLHSLFRLCCKNEDLRKATLEKNLHSLFRLVPEEYDTLRKAVNETNLHSLFDLVDADKDLRKAVVNDNMRSVFRCVESGNYDVEDLRKAVTDKNLHAVFRLLDDEELRKAVVEKNLHSLFRLMPNADNDIRKGVVNENLHALFRLFANEWNHPSNLEDIRAASVERNIHSLFRLLDDEDLRKLVVTGNEWKLFSVLSRYADTHFVKAFKDLMRLEIPYDKDCFSRGQVESKLWLMLHLHRVLPEHDFGNIFLCAGWYATLGVLFNESDLKFNTIRSFDIDESVIKIAEIFNKPLVMDNWRFKASACDIHSINFEGHSYWVTQGSGDHVEMYTEPDTIINTSCEHIENFNEWYSNIPAGKLVVLQSNNYFEIAEHINCVNDCQEFADMAPMETLLYAGEYELEKYKRFMLIGFK